MKEMSQDRLRNLEHKVELLHHGYSMLSQKVQSTTVDYNHKSSPTLSHDLESEGVEPRLRFYGYIGNTFIGILVVTIPIIFAFISALPDACDHPRMALIYSRCITYGIGSIFSAAAIGGLLYYIGHPIKNSDIKRHRSWFLILPEILLGGIVIFFIAGWFFLSNEILGILLSFPVDEEGVALLCSKT